MERFLGFLFLLILLSFNWLCYCNLTWDHPCIPDKEPEPSAVFSNWQALSNLQRKWSAYSCLQDSLLFFPVIMNWNKPSVIVPVCLAQRSMALTRNRNKCHIKMSLRSHIYIQIRQHNNSSHAYVHKTWFVRIFTAVFKVGHSRLIPFQIVKKYLKRIIFMHSHLILNPCLRPVRQVNVKLDNKYTFLYHFGSVVESFPKQLNKNWKELKISKAFWPEKVGFNCTLSVIYKTNCCVCVNRS